MRAALQRYFYIKRRLRCFDNRESCRYIHSSSKLSSTFPSSITFLTDVEGDGHYFDRFIHRSKILGFRTTQPTYGPFNEGNWNLGTHDPLYFPYDKEVVFLDDGSIDKSNSMLVYGGDVWDKGGADFYVIRQLLSLHRRYPDRVHFLMGNRDINKLRIVDELDFGETKRLPKHKGVYWLRGTGLPGDPEHLESATMTETAAERLRWMLRSTMGSVDAFELRRQELQRERLAIMNGQSAFTTQECLDHGTSSDNVKVSDDDVVNSYLQSCNPNSGLMSKYLAQAKLVIRFGPVLFLHGALPTIEANSFPLPWIDPESGDNSIGHQQTFTEWLNLLNDFASEQIASWQQFGETNKSRNAREDFWATKGGYSNKSSGGQLFGNLLQYGMNTLPDKSKNQSVVYNSWMKGGMPRKDLFTPNEQMKLEELFAKESLQLILSGHQPVGDSPWPIQLSGNNWILPCDTSFSGDVNWTKTLQCKSSTKKIGLGRGSRPNGRGEVAVSETLISFCQRTSKVKSVNIHGCLSDGSKYETNNLLDVDDKQIGRPLLRELSYTDKDTGERRDMEFWVKAKIDQDYLLSAGKGFRVWNTLFDHNELD
ncbi:hypothetical protein ACHAWT_004412 [Skeletonema menzelii]